MRSASRNAAIASSYSKLWRSRTPRMNDACAAGAPEVGNEMRPSIGAGCASRTTAAATSTNHPLAGIRRRKKERRRGTKKVYFVPRRRRGRSLGPRDPRTLEREAEHQLPDPHEPRLNVRLPERVARRERVVALQRADGRTVEQVQNFQLDLRLLGAEGEVLLEVGVGVELRRRAQPGDRPRRIAEVAERHQRERRWIDPRRGRVIRRREPILIAARGREVG